MSFQHPGDDKRCDHCNTVGQPYEYMGIMCSGLIAFEGERLCPKCSDLKIAAMTNDVPIQVLSKSRCT